MKRTKPPISLPICAQDTGDGRHHFIALMQHSGARLGTIDVPKKALKAQSEQKANYVVRAVNNHDSLVAALKQAVYLLRAHVDVSSLGGKEALRFDLTDWNEARSIFLALSAAGEP